MRHDNDAAAGPDHDEPTTETVRRRRTAMAMHDTADKLEEGEDRLHRSADRVPDDVLSQRLDNLGDEVSAQARGIAERADRLVDGSR